jgi:hypothetical protein
MSSPYDTGRCADVSDADIDQVATHTDAAHIIEKMLDDLSAHPQDWENRTLGSFLEALSRSLRDLPGLYTNRGEPFPSQPTWKLIAEALVIATGYE